MKLEAYLDSVKGGLIVSCQALQNEPLHSPYIMGKMALAAYEGGAKGIRANSVADILEIKKNVDLPIIGLIKKNFVGSEVYITPTLEEVDALVKAGVDVIATDATKNIRPFGESLETLVNKIRQKHKHVILMADISNVEEGFNAERLGFDIISTTLSGYTAYTKRSEGPDYDLLLALKAQAKCPVFVEGQINTPEEAKKCFVYGAFSIVVGGAITRPQLITQKFVKAIHSVKYTE